MNAFLAIFKRDLTLALRSGGDILTLVLFYTLIGALVPFAVGPDKQLLARLAPGIVWIAAFLSLLLGLDRLFKSDAEDGSIMGFTHANVALSTIVFAKMLAHWLTNIVPLLLATPLLALFMNMPFDTFWRTELVLLVGSPGLLALGLLGAAMTVSIKRGGLITPVIILPLAIPIMIFGVSAIVPNASPGSQSAAISLLMALSLVFTISAPFIAALALKLAAE